MEEASVAGESPDRSKQRESSAEPTSGSAGPVPEKRDPRLAVAREGAPSGSRGSVDTATRVLSAREATEDAAEAEDEPSAKRDDSAAQGDGRLNEAVASWVRSADPVDPVEDASEEASAGAADADAGDRGREKGSEAPGGAQEGPGRAAAATGAVKAQDAPDGGESDSEAAGEGSPSAPDGSQDEGRSEDDDAVRAVKDADEAPGAGSGGTESSEGRDGGSGATGPAAADESEAAEPEDGESADDSEAAGPEAGSTGPEAEPELEPKATEPGDESEGPEPKGPKPEKEPKSPQAEGETEPEAEAAKPGNEPEDPKAAKPGDEPENPKAAKPGDEPENPKAEDGAEDNDPEGGSGSRPKPKGPVDQPTAVFRTGRPAGPAVDQPTTMLKLGDARPGTESEPKSEPKAQPEAEAERTSKFVALKAYDDPAVRKPPPRGGDVTTAVPQIGPERTTQQPLPPRPPLDLLAELTNTPPPPQTPLRTAVRRVKIWTPLVVLLLIVFAVAQSLRPLPEPTLTLTAEDSYTFEGGKPEIPWPADGQAALDVDGIGTFGSSGEQKPVPIASVAKVMTAYLVLREHPLKSGAEGPMIKIDELAEKQSDAGQESTVNVTAGDEISQREAVESILIASANNVARLLARWDAGSEKAFVEKMNEAAKDLGMTNTTYTDPSGLNNTTVSTAVDQVKLARAAMKQPAFREVAAMMSYDDYKGVNHPNWNQLVGSNGVVGIKTGTTTSALGNLVFAAKKDVGGETRTVVGAVVRQPAGGKDNTILSAALTAGDELIRAAQAALESATLLKKGTVVGYVDDGLGGRTPVAVTEDVKAVGWAGLSVKLTFAGDELPHSAGAGTKVGTLTVGDGTSSAVKVPVALRSDLVEPGFMDKLTRIT
ncbi:D-alanyl-D-alanine carboxypeptidase [Streptomyces capillispiralis]|uniref:D-alanyl-D-alanine carboxypeptidase n=1 Tax=Streptomyces capillispiralis TaxID=68182 RepID=UPI00367C3CEE